jgi:hypothetical protein
MARVAAGLLEMDDKRHICRLFGGGWLILPQPNDERGGEIEDLDPLDPGRLRTHVVAPAGITATIPAVDYSG